MAASKSPGLIAHDKVTLFDGLANAPDQKLVRYMKLSTLLMLLHGKAFFPSVNTLRNADPMEGVLPITDCMIPRTLRDRRSEAEITELKKWLLEQAHEAERWSYDKHKDETGGLIADQIIGDFYTREIAKRRAVWCWFKSEDESAAMWSIYGHQEVAIETTLGALHQSLPDNRNFEIGEIEYC